MSNFEYLQCENISLEAVLCNGTEFVLKEPVLNYHDSMFWIYLGIYAFLTLGAGLMSGLTLGLLSLDEMSLEVLKQAGSEKEKKFATRILPLIRNHHILLVTLLLGNAACVESMPIFLDRISDPFTAILVSVTAVLFFGEIIPQAICKRYGLAVGYYCLPIVYFLIALALVLSWPISKLLDCIFGHSSGKHYERAQLKVLVDLHGPGQNAGHKTNLSILSNDFHEASTSSDKTPLLSSTMMTTSYGGGALSDFDDFDEDSVSIRQLYSRGRISSPNSRVLASVVTKPEIHGLSNIATTTTSAVDNHHHQDQENGNSLSMDEVTIIKGALDLSTKVARNAMLPLDSVFMLSSNDLINADVFQKLLNNAHSRVPIFMGTDRRMIQGVLLLKMLLLTRSLEETTVEQLLEKKNIFRPISYVAESTPLYDLLHLFQKGQIGHMAVIVSDGINDSEIEALEKLSEGREVNHAMVSIPPPVLGIITMEDVLEELIQKPIVDESDIYRRQSSRQLLNEHRKSRVFSSQDAARFRRSSRLIQISYEPV